MAGFPDGSEHAAGGHAPSPTQAGVSDCSV